MKEKKGAGTTKQNTSTSDDVIIGGKKRVVLLDMHAILHRSYHALPDFTAPNGEPTGALYGFTVLFFKMLEELKPYSIVACYDLPAPTHRHEAFAEYKGTREKTDDALVAQIIRSKELLDALAIPRLEQEGFEADDLLGTLAEQYKQQSDIEVVIVSGDMDTLQLVDGDVVQVYTLKRGVNDTVLYTAQKVFERYGFPPSRIPDYKGLRGDPSDNIPGIRGIGEKTATTLLTEFEGLDDLFATLKKDEGKVRGLGITPRIITLLKDGEDEARFSKELATITCDVNITPPACESWEKNFAPDRATVFFNELGFRSVIARLRERYSTHNVVEQKVEEVPLSEQEKQEALLALHLTQSDITRPTLEELCEYTNTTQPHVARERILQEVREKELEYVLYNIEIPLVPVVKRMEERGMLLDVPYLATLSGTYHEELRILAQRIYEKA